MNDKIDSVREEVRAHYAAAAVTAGSGQAACCGPDSTHFGSHLYDDLDGVPDAAALASIGCGNPTAVAELRLGETVLDLGSGGGIDVLLSARRVGPTGRVYGVDMTPEMIDLARRNAREAGAGNVEFLPGTIEDIPVPDGVVDVVISNCVINLSPDKPAVFASMHRVLRPGGRIGISDVVTDDHLDAADRAARGSYVGCIAGALPISDYRALLGAAGFIDVSIRITHTVADGVHSAIIKAVKPSESRRVSVRAMNVDDWSQVLAIYEAGIATGHATFETTAPSWERWNAGHFDDHRLVAVSDDGRVVGWVAMSPTSDRCVYGGVGEHSVYVHPDHQRQGVGRKLLDALITGAEAAGIWTIQTGIFPENTASIALHLRCGFRVVGRRERIGQLAGVWRDTLFLERRSTVAGT